jgi:hypothetical protein
MRYKIRTAYDDMEGNKLLKILDDGRIFKIKNLGKGIFRIKESLDNWEWVDFTREQLIDLGNEIIALAQEERTNK